jgi:MFS family permease
VANFYSQQSIDLGRAEGWRDLLRGGYGPLALTLTGGVAVHAVSIYVVATIMPVVGGEIGGVAFFAWTATLYLAGSLFGAAAVPVLLSRHGGRTAYRIAFGAFLTGSLICSLAPSMAVLLLGRLFQGLGDGMLPALAYAMIRQLFPASLHARAIALVGSVWGAAALIGPSIGGLFAQFSSWRGAFWIDVVIGLSFIAASKRVLPQAADATGMRRFPGLRLGLLVAAAICLGCGGAVGRPIAAVLGAGVAFALILLMLRVDAGCRPRMLPGGAFDPRRPLGVLSLTMGLLILASSPSTFLPYLLRAGHAMAPVIGGYVNAIFALSWTLASLLTASAERAGARQSIAAGPWLMLAGLALLAWAVVANLAGLADATSPAQMAVAGAWLFAASSLVPMAGGLVAWRALRLTC